MLHALHVWSPPFLRLKQCRIVCAAPVCRPIRSNFSPGGKCRRTFSYGNLQRGGSKPGQSGEKKSFPSQVNMEPWNFFFCLLYAGVTYSSNTQGVSSLRSDSGGQTIHHPQQSTQFGNDLPRAGWYKKAWIFVNIIHGVLQFNIFFVLQFKYLKGSGGKHLHCMMHFKSRFYYSSCIHPPLYYALAVQRQIHTYNVHYLFANHSSKCAVTWGGWWWGRGQKGGLCEGGGRLVLWDLSPEIWYHFHLIVSHVNFANACCFSSVTQEDGRRLL